MSVRLDVASKPLTNGSLDSSAKTLSSAKPLKSKKGWGAIPAGKRIDVRLVHPWNAPGAIVCRAVLEKLAVNRAVQPLKAEEPMLVIVGGTDMFVSAVHAWNIPEDND